MRTTRLSAINASVGVPPEVSITTAAENVTVAWASTVHAFQGRTVDTVIAAMEANHPNLTNQKTLYVEISRARAELVTDDTKALRERLEAATGERVAALESFGDRQQYLVKSNETAQPVERQNLETGKVRYERGMEM